MKYKVVIFDLDGTLINSIHGIAYSMNTVLIKYGFPTHSVDIYKKFVGNGIKELVRKSLPEKEIKRGNFENYSNEMSLVYGKFWDYQMTAYNGIINLLEFLDENEIIYNVNTSKDEKTTRSILLKYFPGFNFTNVVGYDTLETRKPDPGGAIYIVKKSGYSLDCCVYIGDSDIDIETAKNANINSISVEWGYRTRDELIKSGAERIVSNPGEIIDIFRNAE